MQDKIDKINLVTREKLTGIRVTRGFGTKGNETERFYGVNKNNMANAVKMNNVMTVIHQ